MGLEHLRISSSESVHRSIKVRTGYIDWQQLSRISARGLLHQPGPSKLELAKIGPGLHTKVDALSLGNSISVRGRGESRVLRMEENSRLCLAK